MPRPVTVAEGVTIPDVPDSVTDEQLRKGYEAYRQYGGAPPTTEGEVGVLAAGASGFNEGLARFLGISGDIAQKIVGDPEARKMLLPTGEEITTLAKQHGLVVEPKTGAEQAVSRIGREVGIAAPITAATLGAGAVATTALEAGAMAVAGASRFASLARGLWGQLVGLAQTQPAKFATLEATIAAGGGAGAAAGRKMFPQDADTADLIGTLLGSFGTAGATSLLSTVKNFTKSLFRTRAAAERGTGQFLSRSITPGQETTLEEAIALREGMPGFQPTTLQATGSSDIAGAERVIARQEPGGIGPAFPARVATQQAGTAQATEQAAAGAVPGGDVKAARAAAAQATAAETATAQAPVIASQGNLLAAQQASQAFVTQTQEAVQQRITRVNANLAGYVQRAKQDLDTRLTALGPNATKTDVGIESMRSLADARGAFDVQANEAYVQFSRPGVDVPLRMAYDGVEAARIFAAPPTATPGVFGPVLRNIKKQVDGVIATGVQRMYGKAIGAATPEEVSAVVDSISIPFEWAHRWQADIKGALRKMTTQPDTQVEKAYNIALGQSAATAKDNIGTGILGARDQVGATNPALKEAYDGVTAWYRDTTSRLFNDLVNPAVTSGKVAPESFLSFFFKTGKDATSAAKAFRNAGGDPALVRDFALDDFTAIMRDPGTGALNLSRMKTWINARRDALSAFPDAEKDVMSLYGSARRIAAREERAKGVAKGAEAWGTKAAKEADTQAKAAVDVAEARLRDTTKTADEHLRRIGKGAASLFANGDIDEVVPALLTGPNRESRMRELVISMGGDQTALSGLRSAVWDHLSRRTFAGQVMSPTEQMVTNPVAVRDFLADNSSLMRTLYPPDMLNFTRKLARMAEFSQPTRLPTTEISREDMSQAEAAFLASLWSRAWGVARNVVSPTYVVVEQVLRRTNAITRSLANEEIRAVLERALLDPAVARDLMLAVRTNIPEAQVIRRLHGHLVSMGMRDGEGQE